MTESVCKYIRKIERLCSQDRYRDAFEVSLEFAAVFEIDYHLMEICSTIEWSQEEILHLRSIANSADATQENVLMYALILQSFVEFNELVPDDDIMYYFNLAFEKNSKIALYYMSMIDGSLDADRILHLAELGCAQMYSSASEICIERKQYALSLEYCKKADKVAFDMSARIRRLLHDYPLECCPWSPKWKPNWRESHQYVPKEIREQIKTWLLIATQKKLCAYIRLEISSWIVTPNC